MTTLFSSGPIDSTGDLYVGKIDDIGFLSVHVDDIGSGNTLTLETSTNNTTWVSYSSRPSITARGVYYLNVAAFVYFRIRVSTYSAGTVWIVVDEVVEEAKQTISSPNQFITNSTSASLKISQLGTGPALVVEDSNAPDQTPFLIDQLGRVGIGTGTPICPLNVVANTTTDAVRITQTGFGNALYIEDIASDSTPFLIDTVGRVVIGSESAEVLAGSTPGFQFHSAAATQAAVCGWGTVSNQAPLLNLYRSASGTIGTQGAVSSGFDLGAINFFGDDATAFIPSAQILAEVDGIPGQTAGTFTVGLSYRILSIGTTDFTLIGAASNTVGSTFTATGAGSGTGTAILTTGDMPGRIVFSTTSDGAATTTERMRITSAGNVGIGTTAPNAAAKLDLTSTTRGLLLPRMTTAQRDAITTPPDGLMIYNTSLNAFQGRANGAWVSL